MDKRLRKGEERAYTVRWEIGLPATSMMEAARMALITMRSPSNASTLFEVRDPDTDAWFVMDPEEFDMRQKERE